MLQSHDASPIILFADTGVQIVCIPLTQGLHFPVDRVGAGWQYCKCKANDVESEYGFIQWQIVDNNLFLAIDTTIGPNDGDVGYFAKAESLGGDVETKLHGLLDVNGDPLSDIPPIGFVIRPAAAKGGEPIDVHMVVDFGNSRTGALLVEFRGEGQEPLMTPLQLVNRYRLNAWNDAGEMTMDNAVWWFASQSYWCTEPYRPAPPLKKTVYKERKVKGRLFSGEKTEQVPFEVLESPHTFEDISMVRMGTEADDLAGIVKMEGEVRIGVSSPKRYLWANDDSWLEGANWYMADPFGVFDGEHHATTLKGPLLRFIPEDDAPDTPRPDFEEAPGKPRHAPRTMMIGALYEMLCQAYSYINSPSYRHLTNIERMRLLRSLTLTFPSGMISQEREQLRKQAQKAVDIFMQTLGKSQPVKPEVELSVDEASAVHLTYIWSEVNKLGRKASLWFSLVGHEPEPQPAQPEPERAAPPTARSGGARSSRPVRARNRPSRAERSTGSNSDKSGPEVRIACIDIGGGTSDLMIAKYVCRSKTGGSVIEGESLHRDGISTAGDHLIKRLLETVIVPRFVDVVGLDPNDAQTLFGKEVPANLKFRTQRIHWTNRLLVPLAQAYLEAAVDEVADDVISHTDPNLVDPEVVQALQDTINRVWGPGVYNVSQDLDLYYDAAEFEDVVDEVFGDLLFDFCESIVEHKVDVVLLAGQPTKLRCIRELVETYLPLPMSRIVPMYDHYAGTWYPYQSPDGLNPGVIVDPKSAVVVGAALESSARHGKLPQFRLNMTDTAAKGSYYWGIMTQSGIDGGNILFDHEPDGLGANVQMHAFDVNAERYFVGRKRRSRDNAQATPVYLLKVIRGQRLGEVEAQVKLERRLGHNGEEELRLASVEGIVDGEPAVWNRNVLFEWRTLADERYYLDTGGLDLLEL